jgi:hypothetical protein
MKELPITSHEAKQDQKCVDFHLYFLRRCVEPVQRGTGRSGLQRRGLSVRMIDRMQPDTAFNGAHEPQGLCRTIL